MDFAHPQSRKHSSVVPDLFAKLEDDRFMGQDGLPVYKYYEPNPLKRAYRTAADMMYRPEFITPLAASFAGAVSVIAGAESMFAADSVLKSAASTFALSTMLGYAGGMLPNQFLFNFQRPLGIIHSYFDKRPEKEGIDEHHQGAAKQMKRLHGIFAGVAVASVAGATASVGISPEFFGVATSLIAAPLAHRSRYTKVERGDWGFYDFRGGPPRGKRMPEKEKAPKAGALQPL